MELQTALRILRAHWVSILVLGLVGVLTAAGWAFLQPRVYNADASGYVAGTGEGGGSSDSGSALLANNLALAKVVSYVDIGSWRSVAEHAIEKLSLSESPETLVRRVKVSNVPGTVTIRVDASAGSPESARDLAEAWLEGMSDEIESLETGGGTGVASVRLVPGDTARLPTSPSSPNTQLALLLGGALGIAAGLAYAIARYTLDRRIRSADLVERETGVSVVGTVPVEKTFSNTSRLVSTTSARDGRLFAVSEAVRELRTNIQFMDVDHPPRVIVVTSPLPGDGKSTISGNLALVMAAAGQNVVLIDGDLRRPMVASVFGLVEGAGLTDVLSGRAEFDDVVQSYGGTPNLRILAAGRTPPNPSEVLGSDRMRELMRRLAIDSTVIVDAPPLLPVTDAAVLTHSADGAIIVVGVGRTTIEMLRKAISTLERVGGRALGVVLNRVPKSGGSYHDYRYTGSYQSAPDDDDALVAEAVGASDAQLTSERGGSSAVEPPLRRSRRRPG